MTDKASRKLGKVGGGLQDLGKKAASWNRAVGRHPLDIRLVGESIGMAAELEPLMDETATLDQAGSRR